jgi:hypothetical protein
LKKNWIDQGISWNPNNFGGIKLLRIPATSIWTPDLFFYNAAEDSSLNMWDTTGNFILD